MSFLRINKACIKGTAASRDRTNAVQDENWVWDLLIKAIQENKWFRAGEKLENDKLSKRADELLLIINSKPSTWYCNKTWQTPTKVSNFPFWFLEGTNEELIHSVGKCHSVHWTLFTQFNVQIVLFLHLKSLGSASDMIYWMREYLSSCINLGFGVPPFAALAASCYLCCCWELINIS